MEVTALPALPSPALAIALLAGLAAPPAFAQASVSLSERPAVCDSAGQAAPAALFERFISADCAACWSAADTPRPPAGALVLDWVLPGTQGEEAPLSAVARREAQERLDSLGLRSPDQSQQRSHLGPIKRAGNATNHPFGAARLRVAHGLPLGGYMGASLRFEATPGARGPFTGWLAVVELLPAGTEGSPVPRALVRNLLSGPIAARPQDPFGQLWRPMNVPEVAAPERLEVLGWVSDAQGRVLVAAQSRCERPR